MTTRTMLLATTLALAAVAFGGVSTPLGEIAFVDDASASCTNIDLGDIQTGCIESATCRALERATGRPWNCIE